MANSLSVDINHSDARVAMGLNTSALHAFSRRYSLITVMKDVSIRSCAMPVNACSKHKRALWFGDAHDYTLMGRICLCEHESVTS